MTAPTITLPELEKPCQHCEKGVIRGATCRNCEGVGFLPTEEGLKVLSLLDHFRLRHSPLFLSRADI